MAKILVIIRAGVRMTLAQRVARQYSCHPIVTECLHQRDSLLPQDFSRTPLERFMRHRWLIVLLVCILAGPFVLIISAADPPDPGITLIGKGEIPGDALDLSGLDGLICSLADGDVCISRATLGGFGSGLAYTGHDDVFIGVPDRGPFDGRTEEPYLDRFHFFHI